VSGRQNRIAATPLAGVVLLSPALRLIMVQLWQIDLFSLVADMRIVMTTLLETAFAEASKLSPQDQDELAAWLLEELKSEHRWRNAFVQSADILAELADEALNEYHAGKTRPLDPDAL
jgi:hypothetical protein